MGCCHEVEDTLSSYHHASSTWNDTTACEAHERGNPTCGSVTYGVTKELTKILKPLVGKSPHHISSTQDFVEQVKHITLASGECLSSYDVSALFTSVLVDPTINIMKDLLEKDYTLKERTVLAVSDIILLLEFLSQEHLLFFPRPIL